MTSPSYITSCPSCGQQLEPHAGDAQSCPWICNNCHFGFWTAELQPGTRAHYRPHLKDFGSGPHMKHLKDARYLEYLDAFFRGTSAREDQLPLLTHAQLQSLKLRGKVDPGFMKLVDGEHARRGAK